jgi:hypothetical protein
VQTLRAQETLSYDSLHPLNEDSFNMFFPLPPKTLDGTTHMPHHQGVDFKYDSIKRELRVTFRFRCAPSFDPVVMAHVGNLPAPKEESSGSKDSNDNDDDLSAIDNIELEEGNHLGNDDYLLTIHHVLSSSTHAVINIIKSQDHNFAVGSERILTMDRAHELYRE